MSAHHLDPDGVPILPVGCRVADMVDGDGRAYPSEILRAALRDLRRRECEAQARGEYAEPIPGGCILETGPEAGPEAGRARQAVQPDDEVPSPQFEVPAGYDLDETGAAFFHSRLAALVALRRGARNVSAVDVAAIADAAQYDRTSRTERAAEASIRADFWIDQNRQARAARQAATASMSAARLSAQRLGSTGLGRAEKGKKASARENSAMAAQLAHRTSRWAGGDLA